MKETARLRRRRAEQSARVRYGVDARAGVRRKGDGARARGSVVMGGSRGEEGKIKKTRLGSVRRLAT